MVSEIRLKLLFNLYESSKSIKELESEFQKKSGNISRGLNELKSCGLITRQSNKQYAITSTGYLVTQNLKDLILDPQTSGGLLISLPEKDAKIYLSRMEKHTPWSKIIGQVTDKKENQLLIF